MLYRPDGPAAPIERFGTAPDGTPVHRVRLEGGGTRAAILTWGASLQDFRVDAHDRPLVLGSPAFEAYPTVMRHFGAIAGRVANRIAGGRAPLGDGTVELERNEAGRTTLHAGSTGTGISLWKLEGTDRRSCALRITCPDGASGFPGTLHATAVYRLDDAGALVLEIEAHADAPTFCNFASHAYWSLDGGADLSGHTLQVAASRYLPVDEAKIPLGPPAPVEGRFDFRQPRAVMAPGDGPLDHNFCLDAPGGAATACSLAAGGLRLDVTTTEPGLQLYDGGALATAPHPGHGGAPYGAHAGLAIEPQRWPDAPNHPDYPSILLEPGQRYSQRTRFHVHPDS
ncbi:MAG: aldose epimerase family protein [Pseudomonadota bacterium]